MAVFTNSALPSHRPGVVRRPILLLLLPDIPFSRRPTASHQTSSEPFPSLIRAYSIRTCLRRLVKVLTSAIEPLIHIMRLSPCPHIRLSSVILLIPSLATATFLDCSDVRDDGVSFNFMPLEGPHSLYRIKEQPNGFIKTTFTIDICRPLKKPEGVPKDEDCPNNSRGRPISRRQ